MEQGEFSRMSDSDARAAEPGPDGAATYEPPRLTVLGSVAELTAGGVVGNSDLLGPGPALS